MLYDPKWETTTTKPDVFSLESLIAWLEKQPARCRYCFADNGNCLTAQYLTAHGFKNVSVGVTAFHHHDADDAALPEVFNDIAYEDPRTFGAALKRARAALKV